MLLLLLWLRRWLGNARLRRKYAWRGGLGYARRGGRRRRLISRRLKSRGLIPLAGSGILRGGLPQALRRGAKDSIYGLAEFVNEVFGATAEGVGGVAKACVSGLVKAVDQLLGGLLGSLLEGAADLG